MYCAWRRSDDFLEREAIVFERIGNLVDNIGNSTSIVFNDL